MTNKETHWSNHPGDEGPVTVSVSRKVKPGSEAAYEQCVSDLVSAAADFKGHQGATILRPSQPPMMSTSLSIGSITTPTAKDGSSRRSVLSC